MTEKEAIKKEILETRIAQKQYAFGSKKQNASMFGQYERKLEELYKKLDKEG